VHDGAWAAHAALEQFAREQVGVVELAGELDQRVAL
jgi:hypothetical protein